MLCTLTTTSIPQSTSMPIYSAFPLATADEKAIHSPFTCPLVLSPSTYSRTLLQKSLLTIASSFFTYFGDHSHKHINMLITFPILKKPPFWPQSIIQVKPISLIPFIAKIIQRIINSFPLTLHNIF